MRLTRAAFLCSYTTGVITVATWTRPAPAIVDWIQAHRSSNPFASSLSLQFGRWGTLSLAQIQAVEGNLNPRTPPPAPVTANVAGPGFSKLFHSFQRAKSTGLKYPKVHIGALRFSLAAEDSRNPGHLYVKHHGEYAGKISPAGEFSRAYGVDPPIVDAITQVARDPLAAAVQHGHMTGRCAICSKLLSDSESVARGIGPVCAKRFGWLE